MTPSYVTLAEEGLLLWGTDDYEVWELDGTLFLVEFAHGTAHVSSYEFPDFAR